MDKRFRWLGAIFALVLTIATTLNVPAIALECESTYYYEYYEPVDDVPKVKKNSNVYKTIQKFLYDVAKHVPYVSGTTDCSGEATRALCYGLGGANYYGKISLADTTTKAALYLNGNTVTWVGSYYNVVKDIPDGTKVTLKSYDGTSAIYTKYCVKNIPTLLQTQGDVNTIKKAFSYAKHAGAICFYYNNGGHMWISLGQFPESLSDENLATYLNNTYLAGTGAAIDPYSKTQSTSDRYEIYMHLAQWQRSWSIFRATSDSPTLGMGINNVYTGSGYGDMYILVPEGAEDTSTVTTQVKVEAKDSVTGSVVSTAKFRVYEYDAYNGTYNEYDSKWYVDLEYSNGAYVLPAKFSLNGVSYTNRQLKITGLNGGRFKIVNLDSNGNAVSTVVESTVSGNNQTNFVVTGSKAVVINPTYGLRVNFTDPEGNMLSGGKFTFSFDNVTYYGLSRWDGSVVWYASEADMNNGYPALGADLSLKINKNTVGVLKQTYVPSDYRMNKQYAEGVQIDLVKGSESGDFAKYSTVTVACVDNNSLTIRRQDSLDGKVTTEGVNYLLELNGILYFGRTDSEGYIVWYTRADRTQIISDSENNGRTIYLTGITTATGLLTELGTEGYADDKEIYITVGGSCDIIVDAERIICGVASGSISRPLD